MNKADRRSRVVLILIVLITSLISILLFTACSVTSDPADSLRNRSADQTPGNTGNNGQNTAKQNIQNTSEHNNQNIPYDPRPNPIDVNQEKIGCGYTVPEGPDLAPDNSHGSVKNYHSDFQGKLWTVTFDAMNSTAYQPLEIDSRDTLKVRSKLVSGTVWIKITQGDLSKSALQKVQLVKDETITLDLSRWETGEIAVWLVVENGESGIIRVEQDFYARSYLSTLSYYHIIDKSWLSPKEIEVSHLLNCALYLTSNERAGNKGFRQEDQKLHVPAEVAEPLVYRFFDVSPNDLRTSSVYVPEEDSYVFRSGPLGSLFFEIDGVSRQDGIATIEFHYYDYPTLAIRKKVTLVVDESGKDNKYLSCEVTEPTPADQKAAAAPAAAPDLKRFSKGFATNWSFTGKPQGEDFHGGRDIFGVSFSLTYDAASGKYKYNSPGMGDCDKIISYTLTGTDFTVALNGKYKLLYPDIPAYVGFYTYDTNGKLKPMDGYRMKSTDIVTGADGNYYLKIPFNWPYRKGEIPYLSFNFGKID